MIEHTMKVEESSDVVCVRAIKWPEPPSVFRLSDFPLSTKHKRLFLEVMIHPFLRAGMYYSPLRMTPEKQEEEWQKLNTSCYQKWVDLWRAAHYEHLYRSSTVYRHKVTVVSSGTIPQSLSRGASVCAIVDNPREVVVWCSNYGEVTVSLEGYKYLLAVKYSLDELCDYVCDLTSVKPYEWRDKQCLNPTSIDDSVVRGAGYH